LRKKKSDPANIADIRAAMQQESALGEQLEQARIWENWPELAGSALAGRGMPVSVRDGTLTIEAESPVWMHKFAYHKWAILKRINRMAGRELVSDLFIRLAGEE
jgi:predicted nucleic acid-binding Zn ribbon protein